MTPNQPCSDARTAYVVIGGTGMLWPMVEQLSQRGSRVHALGRRERSGTQLANVQLHAGDWHEREAYVRILKGIAVRTPLCVVAWLHREAAVTHEQIHEVLKPMDYLEVRGTSKLTQDEYTRTPDGRRRVLLGEIRQGHEHRWLTHQEISAGVLRAIDSQLPLSLVGQRPS